jgi:hypothetical protein
MYFDDLQLTDTNPNSSSFLSHHRLSLSFHCPIPFRVESKHILFFCLFSFFLLGFFPFLFFCLCLLTKELIHLFSLFSFGVLSHSLDFITLHLLSQNSPLKFLSSSTNVCLNSLTLSSSHLFCSDWSWFSFSFFLVLVLVLLAINQISLYFHSNLFWKQRRISHCEGTYNMLILQLNLSLSTKFENQKSKSWTSAHIFYC